MPFDNRGSLVWCRLLAPIAPPDLEQRSLTKRLLTAKVLCICGRRKTWLDFAVYLFTTAVHGVEPVGAKVISSGSTTDANNDLGTERMIDWTEELKRSAAERAIDFVHDGQTVGLGTGSTAAFAIHGLASRVQRGLRIQGVPTSIQSANLARRLGIPLVDFNEISSVDVTIDGADQIDPNLDMIKGGGGALTREKLVARASRVEVIVVDRGKRVSALGEGFPLPVEVIPFGWRMAARLLSELGCVTKLRETAGAPLVTDNGNWILDSDFGRIEDAGYLEKHIKLLPGVVESGLFVGLADVMVVGAEDGVQVQDRPEKKKLSRLDEI